MNWSLSRANEDTPIHLLRECTAHERPMNTHLKSYRSALSRERTFGTSIVLIREQESEIAFGK